MIHYLKNKQCGAYASRDCAPPLINTYGDWAAFCFDWSTDNVL